MSKELAVNSFETLKDMSTVLFKSGYFADVKSEAQAIVKVLAGAELGLPPFASMAGIHIISGRPALGSNVIATLVKNDPRYNYKVVECTAKTCTIDWQENGQSVGQSSFTIDEATTAGLTNNPSWKKFPSDMLFARAITRGARRYAPGIFGGSPIYTPEELGLDTDEEGYIDASHRIIDEPKQSYPVKGTIGEDVYNAIMGKNDEPSLVDVAVELGGTVKNTLSVETAEKTYNGKTIKIHTHEYPQSWSKIVSAFVPKKIDNTYSQQIAAITAIK